MILKLWHFIIPLSNEKQVAVDPWTKTQWLIFWLFWSILVSAIYWVLGPHSYLRIQDNADFNVPYRITAARDLLEYGITFWQPKFSGGMPSLVHPMVDSFAIDGLPYLVLPAWVVYGLVMWMQRFLAGYFTYRLCRDILGLDAVGSLFAGLAYSLYLWSVQDWKLVDAFGLPAVALTLFLFDKIMMHPWRRGIGLALLMGMVLALVSQSVIHTFFMVGALPFWLLIIRQSKWSAWWSRYGAFAGGAMLMEAPLFITLMTYSPTTTRGQGSVTLEIPSLIEKLHHTWGSIGWSEWPQNGLYLGLFFLGLFAARANRKALAWRLLFIFLLSGIGAEVGHWLQHVWQNVIPPSRGNMLDFNQFTIFFGPLLGGMGLHLLRESGITASHRIRVWITLVTLFALAMPVVNLKEVTRQLLHRLSTDNYAINFNNPVLQELAQQQKNTKNPFRVASVGTWPPGIAGASGDRIYPTYVHAYGFESVDGYYRLHSARYHQFWRRVITKALAVYPEQTERTIKWYYLFMSPEKRFVNRAPLDLDAWYNLDLLSLANTRFLISHWPLNHPALTLIHNPVSELAQGQEWDKLRLREKVWQTLQGHVPHHALYVYENKSHLPRAFMTRNFRVLQNASTLLEALSTTSVAELRQTALLEQPVSFDKLDFSYSEIQFDQYTPDHIQLTVNSDGPGLLVLTNNFDPYWKVTINGQPGSMMPVYHTFQGMFLTGGKNQVVLDYWPPYRTWIR
ncbi:MAG: YfhO family protein [Magnetococcus sp. YQC-5]